MPSATGCLLKLSFNFAQQIRFCGWTETYALSYADLPTAIAALTNIKAFIQKRVFCLGIGPLLLEASLAGYVQPLHPGDPPVRRGVISLDIPPLPAPGAAYNKALSFGAGPEFYNAEFASTCYYMRAQTNLSSTPVYARNIWISGLPDVADTTGSARIVDPATNAAVTDFISALSNKGPNNASKNGVSIKSIDRTGGNPVKACQAWNQAPNTYTVNAHLFVVGQPIQALGMKTVPGGTCPRGRYLVATTPDANTISLAGAATPTSPEKTGGFRASISAFNQIALIQPQGFTKRDKGRPSGLAVGRRKTPVTVPA